MAAGPPPRGAAEAEPLLDTSARLVDIKNARRIAQFLTSVIALATFVVLAIHNGTGRGSWGGVVDSRPSTSASPVHGMPYVPITGRSRLARRVDDTPDATRRALRRERLEIDFQNEYLIANLNGETLATVPDLICIVTEEEGEPVSTEVLHYGTRVAVLAVPAPAALKTAAALRVVGPAAFGYDVPFTPLPGDLPDDGEMRAP